MRCEQCPWYLTLATACHTRQEREREQTQAQAAHKLPLPLPLLLPRSTVPRCRKCLPEVAGKSGSNSSCNATPAHTRTCNTQVISVTARKRGRESEQRESEIKVSSCKFLVSFPLFLGIRWQFATFQPLSTVEGYPMHSNFWSTQPEKS